MPALGLRTSAPELRDYGLESFHPQRDVVAATKELMERIHDDFQYDPTATEVATPLREVFEGRRGVCQDFALRPRRAPPWACLRLIAPLFGNKPSPGGEKLVGADASHAWFALYMPEQGWLEFDPTNRQRPTERYVFLGQGRTTVTRRHSAGSSRGRTSRGSCERRCARPAAGVTKGGGQP